MQLLILDDEAEIIVKMVHTIESLLIRHNIDTHVFFTSEELIEYSSSYNDIFLAILDINLCNQELDGIQAAQHVKFFCPNTMIIFCSTYVDKYSSRLLKTELFTTIKKSEMAQLPRAILQAKREYDAIHGTGIIEFEYVFYKIKYTINLMDVFYFTSSGRKVIIKKADGETFFYDKLDNIEKKVNEQIYNGFIRVSKSYLVNIDYIDRKEKDKIKVGNDWIKITRNFKANINL